MNAASGLGPAPHWFGLPPGADFPRALVAGLRTRGFLARPEDLARAVIWTNTSRSARALSAALERDGVFLLPRIRVVTELDLQPPGGAAQGLHARLELARLVTRLIAAEPGLAPPAARFGLADALFDLFAEFQDEGLDPAALNALDLGAFAEHWQLSRRFLAILTSAELTGAWFAPGLGLMAGARAEVASWQEAPPPGLMLVAGSTGSRAATRFLMQAAARLPQGAVILPGFDAGQAAADWSLLGPDHPQCGFRLLAESADPPFDPATIRPWAPVPDLPQERAALVTLALRPARATHHWLDEGRAFAPRAAGATAGLGLIEAADEGEEALAIALALRQALEGPGTAALVSPSRSLSRRVAAILGRWGILPDDSAGTPLALTPPGVFLRLTCGWAGAGSGADPAALIATLAHPLAGGSGAARVRHLGHLRRLERNHLRGGPHRVTPAILAALAPADDPDYAAWLGWLGWLGPVLALGLPAEAGLGTMAAAHRLLAETLSSGPDATPPPLWDQAAGQACHRLLEALEKAAADLPDLALTRADYAALLAAELSRAGEIRDPGFLPDPRLAIWGTLEARTQHADLVILGGLNENGWPRRPDPGPWLSAAMREGAGLPPIARRTGLAAHDFQQAALAPRVLLSRAMREGGKPAVASRWLLRLTNLLRGMGAEGEGALSAMQGRGALLLTLARRLSGRLPEAAPAPRPAPAPPRAALPESLSVSDAETLIRDPYAFYARTILRLRPLEAPGQRPDAARRGVLLHRVIEAWIRATLTDPAALSRAGLMAVAETVLTRDAPWPAARARWQQALAANATHLVADEIMRRATARPLTLEHRGALRFAVQGRSWTLTARPDRIDQAGDGSWLICDYKSGGLPSGAAIAFDAKQLTFEAVMALGGAFGPPPPAIAGLQYLSLTQARTAAVDLDQIETEWDRFQALLARLGRDGEPFIARLKGAAEFDDYLHLSRFGEWQEGAPPGTGAVP